MASNDRSRTPSPPVANAETIPENVVQIQLNHSDFPSLSGNTENSQIKPMSKPPGRNINSHDDFPSLGNVPPPSHVPPPGFANMLKETSNKTKQNNPPPGFKKKSPPIEKKCETTKPSFKQQGNTDSALTQKPVTTSTTSITASEKDVQIVKKTNGSRNQAFIEDVKMHLGNDIEKFRQFKTFSGNFRQGHCSAREYYTNCTQLFGSNFRFIFNELVSLLPDSDKQTELLAVHNDFKAVAKQNGEVVHSNGVKRPPQIAWGATPANQPKPVKPVKQDSMARHESDFPSLPTAGPRQKRAINVYRPTNTQPMKSAWVRGK